MGLIAGQATKIQHVIRCGQKETVRDKEVLTKVRRKWNPCAWWWKHKMVQFCGDEYERF